MKRVIAMILTVCIAFSLAACGGSAGMMLQGSWMVNTFYTAENAADYAWAQIPYHDTNGNGQCDEGERVSLYNGLGWAASAETKNPDAAYSLISAFCSEEGQKKQAELGVTMGGMKGAAGGIKGGMKGVADIWGIMP